MSGSRGLESPKGSKTIKEALTVAVHSFYCVQNKLLKMQTKKTALRWEIGN